MPDYTILTDFLQNLTIFVLSEVVVMAALCGCAVKPIEATEIPPTRQFVLVESVCTAPENPSTLLEKIPGLSETFDSTTFTLSKGQTIEVKDYTNGSITTNAVMAKKAYEFFESIRVPQDLDVYGGELSLYTRSPIVDSTIIIFHDGKPSQYLGCTPGALAMTVNAYKDSSVLLPDVSEVSLQRILASNGGKVDQQLLTYAAITEVCQQHSYSRTNVSFNESLCNGYGFLVSFVVQNIGNEAELERIHAAYKGQASIRVTYSTLNNTPIPFAIFDLDTFKRARETFTEPVFVWNE